MLTVSAQMTAQLELTGANAEQVDRISALILDAALGRLGPANGPRSETITG